MLEYKLWIVNVAFHKDLQKENHHYIPLTEYTIMALTTHEAARIVVEENNISDDDYLWVHASPTRSVLSTTHIMKKEKILNHVAISWQKVEVSQIRSVGSIF